MPKRKEDESVEVDDSDMDDVTNAVDEPVDIGDSDIEDAKPAKSAKPKSAEPKSKKPRPTGDDPRSVVLRYMLDQNRPYNSTTILNNLHNIVGKAALERALTELTDEGQCNGQTTIISSILWPTLIHSYVPAVMLTVCRRADNEGVR